MRRIVFLLPVISLFLFTACGSSDLSLINEVKRFEPEWMNLSEKVTFVDRYLRITEKRYEADLNEVDPLISGTSSEAYQLKNQYKSMMNEQKVIMDNFAKQKEEFSKAVSEFNVWQNKLMKNKLAIEKAKVEFDTFKDRHNQLTNSITDHQNELVKNIERHNSLMRRITRELKVYTNYDIRYE
ncbi:MAG: hypothetical protein MRZ79_14630 [Bacteroidia bacterium]|nr:hypothetical protein [Bacteroidia bacterium]